MSNGFLVISNTTLRAPYKYVMFTIIPGLFWRLMSQHQTTMEDNCYFLMMATCTYLQVMEEWQGTHLENMGIPRTSKEDTNVLT